MGHRSANELGTHLDSVNPGCSTAGSERHCPTGRALAGETVGPARMPASPWCGR